MRSITPEKDLFALSDVAKMRVDALAEAWRESKVPVRKDALYARQGGEAAAWIAAGQPSVLVEYPYLTAEVLATGTATLTIANAWVARETQWVTDSAAIDQLVRQAHTAIEVADSPEEQDAAVAWFSANLP
jgi:hypothetical protein